MYYLLIDVETANSLEHPLVYDLGYAIIDERGKVFQAESLIIYDVYRLERGLMSTAYYADKLFLYEKYLTNGESKMTNFVTAKKKIHSIAKKWQIQAIIAHNAYFDYNALNTTLRFLTNSRERYFLPYGIPIWDTVKMAKQVFSISKDYKAFCKKRRKERAYFRRNRAKRTMTLIPRVTAEILYQYITKDEDFKEEHTGLSDVLIEKEIFAHCMKEKPDCNKTLFKDKPQIKNTPLQWQILKAAKLQESVI